MKKSITKRLLTIAMAATLCLSSSIYAYSAICYTVGISTIPYYGDNRDFDLLSNVDTIISALYETNGTNNLKRTNISITDDKQAHAVGQIMDTILDCNTNALALSASNVDKMYVQKNGDYNYSFIPGERISDPTSYYYIGWFDTEDHTKDIDNIKVALDEAKRIAATVPDGTNEEKLRYIYDYVLSISDTIDTDESSLYDTLILRRSCCRGKSAAIYTISLYAGLPIGLVGYKTNHGVGHSANYTYYEDGTIKYIDAAMGPQFLSDHYSND